MTTTVFIHAPDTSQILEATLPVDATLDQARAVLAEKGVPFDKQMFLFVDEDEQGYQGEGKAILKGVKQGAHLHISCCRRIKVTVNYLERSLDRDFAPGVRVRAVKAWAVDKFNVPRTDAGEHILRLCNSTVVPPTDTPLHTLTARGECAVCFDLVPEKRVEG